MPHIQTPISHYQMELNSSAEGVWLSVRTNVGDMSCYWLPETPLTTILEWLCDPLLREDTQVRSLRIPWHSREISFEQTTGMLVLHHPARSESFDPNDDESLAKFVRKLKSIAPIPPSEGQTTLPVELPRVTESDLKFKRTIYSHAMAAEGVKRPNARHKSTRTLSGEAASKKLDSILESLIAQRKQTNA